MKNRPSMPRPKVELTDDPWGCLCQDRRLTNKITRRFLMCIKVEALGLFVLLFLAIETCIKKRSSRHLPYHLLMGSHSHFVLLHVVDCFL